MAIKVTCEIRESEKEEFKKKQDLFFKSRKELHKGLAGPGINGETIYNLLKFGKDEVEFPDKTQRRLILEEVV